MIYSISVILVSVSDDGQGFARNPEHMFNAGQEPLIYLKFEGEQCNDDFVLDSAFHPAHNFLFACTDSQSGELVFESALSGLFLLTRNDTEILSLRILPAALSSETSFIKPPRKDICEDSMAEFEFHLLDEFKNPITQYCNAGALQIECSCSCEISTVQMEENTCLVSVRFHLAVFSKNVRVEASSFGLSIGPPVELVVRFGSTSSVWLNPLIGALLLIGSVVGYWFAFLRRGSRFEGAPTDIE